MKEWQKNLVLVCVSTVAGLALAEAATRLVWTESTHALHQVLPGGMRLAPNTDGTYHTEEFEFTVQSNRFGHRDWEWDDAVMKDACNILFVGDSFVFGYGVNAADSVPSLLEVELERAGRKTEVFNLGLGGGLPEYGVLTREAIEQEGIHAKTILVGLFLGNDFTELPVYTRQTAESSGWLSRLRLPRPDDSALYRLVKTRASGSASFTGLMFRTGRFLGRDIYPTSTGYIFLREWTDSQQELFNSFLRRMTGIAEMSSEKDRDVVFVIFPNRVQVENASDLTSSVYDASLPGRRILDYCLAEELECVDLLPALRHSYDADRQALFFPIDRHMNAAGNRIAAKTVFSFLQSRDRLCSE